MSRRRRRSVQLHMPRLGQVVALHTSKISPYTARGHYVRSCKDLCETELSRCEIQIGLCAAIVVQEIATFLHNLTSWGPRFAHAYIRCLHRKRALSHHGTTSECVYPPVTQVATASGSLNRSSVTVKVLPGRSTRGKFEFRVYTRIWSVLI